MGTGMDMRSTTKTRVQRRIEKKQALMLVALVLVISVVSFVLGVIVGRHSGEATVVQQVSGPQRINVKDNLVAPAEQVTPTIAQPVEEQLTFYDNLSKDEVAPIGSGINLPPDSKQPKLVAEINAPATSAEITVISPELSSGQVPASALINPAPITVSVPANTEVRGELPTVVKGGGWVVQVFSSKSAADAGLLRDKLGGKGYPAFIAEADLGKKGIWYRVFFGPYADKTAAIQAQAYAAKKDKLTGFAKRR